MVIFHNNILLKVYAYGEKKIYIYTVELTISFQTNGTGNIIIYSGVQKKKHGDQHQAMRWAGLSGVICTSRPDSIKAIDV